MQTELIVNIVIISVVGTFVTVIIAIRIYISCCRPQSQTNSNYDDIETASPQFDLKEQDIFWESTTLKLKNNDQCCICLEKRVNTVTSCNHKFHLNCLMQWKKRLKNTCPYCKGQSLQKITFYCQQCRILKFQYEFIPPIHNPRNHMIPKFFFSYNSPPKKLICTHCKEIGTENPECISRNFDSVKESGDNKTSKKTSRSRQPVDIVIKQSRSSQQKQSQFQSENNEGVGQPITNNRLLIKINY